MDETFNIPFELDYTINSSYNNKIDWSALIYDDWTTFDFWAKKYPAGLLDQFPELNVIVDATLQQKKDITPLMELQMREKCSEKK